ncbi:MAG: hypothetical protein QW416_00490 [Candidatus Nitrosocaldaceae archaeon]
MTIKWYDKDKGMKDRIKDMFKSKDDKPIKPQLEETRRILQLNISKLNSISMKLDEKDKMLFNKVVNDMQKRDEQHAIILSNELTQIRKIKRMVNNFKMALEQIELRLGTMTDVGEVIVSLRPAMSIVNSIKDDVLKITPETHDEMNNVTSILNELIISSNMQDSNIAELPINEDTEKILEEASKVLEMDVKGKLPELPSNMQVKPTSNVKKSTKRYPDLPSTKSKKKMEASI